MQTATLVADGLELFLAQYRRQEESRLSAAEPEWLKAQRLQAIQSFADTGFPTTRNEDWRYTNVGPIVQTPFQTQVLGGQPEAALPGLWQSEDAARLIFFNGIFNPKLSTIAALPAGAVVGSLRSLLSDSKFADTLRVYFGRTLSHARDAFASLNSALFLDGACVLVPRGATLTRPIHLVYVSISGSGPVVSHPRTLVICEPDTQISVVETYLSADNGIGFSNSVTEVIAGENSVVDLYKSAEMNSGSSHIGLLQIYASGGAQVSALAASLGGALVRNAVHATLDAEGADCTLNGLYAAKDTQHVDNHTTIDHAKPHGASRQFYNGILDGHSTAVFNGRVIVRPDAQKTDAIQKNRNLLLSADATIDTKPQLEISANDVRCTHGATVGQMDQEALFFLRSRGLDQQEASALLVRAFASEILDKVKLPEYRGWIEDRLRTSFLGAAAGPRK